MYVIPNNIKNNNLCKDLLVGNEFWARFSHEKGLFSFDKCNWFCQ